jgi:dihydroorotase
VFLERVLTPLRRDFPALKIVLEHVTTADGVAFVEDGPPGIAGTITPQHLILNRNALFAGGLRPHAYCLPVVKRERHRLALRRAATSGSDRFFLGTDSAPHAVDRKESSCGCAGHLQRPACARSLCQRVRSGRCSGPLEAFASEHGPRFYGLPLNEGTITLERSDERVPEKIGDVVPFGAGEASAGSWPFSRTRASPRLGHQRSDGQAVIRRAAPWTSSLARSKLIGRPNR